MNTAIEVEYWVVTDDGHLTAPGSLVDLAEYVDPEFVEPVLEIKTSPCETIEDLREELFDRLRYVVRAARRDGKHLVPLATPIHAQRGEIPYRESERTDLQRTIVGPQFGDARHCAGTHIHFERQGGDATVDQFNTLTALDPAFALLNTSSYYRGERLLECVRPYLYRKCCYNGRPEQGQLWSYVDSVDEWETRLESAFEDFREIARKRGVDMEAFDAAFNPYSAVWSPVKLRDKFPTVEWRSPDTALPSRVLELTGDIHDIVDHAVENGTTVGDEREWLESAPQKPLTLPPFESVERIVDGAMRDGCNSPSVSAYLAQLGLDPEKYADGGPLEATTSRSGAHDRLSPTEARTLRLDAAARLEADLEQTPTPVDTTKTSRYSITSLLE